MSNPRDGEREVPLSPNDVQLAIRISNDLDEIDGVIERFNAFAAGHGIPDAVRRTFDIAFDELLNNIISYGYAEGAERWIAVDIRLVGDELEVVIVDDAVAFDPFARAAPDTELSLEDRAIGGLGIHLVTKMMDRATYERDDDKNVMVIAKRWRGAPGAQPDLQEAKDDAD